MAGDIEVTESDEAGNVTATYIQSPTQQGGVSRVDVIFPEISKTIWQRGLDIFLPSGYPHSVTNDYTEYQIYDSLQAFSSSIAGLLSSRAVLSSVGVGDSTASPTAALLLSILQELAGRVATILFAYRFGTSLEPECKMYRLLADILNDIAFILDCLSPALPKVFRVIVLSFSSALRALCGVAAGSAKASLSAHFAQWGNLGELNAKDSSQETVISLLGMLAGTLVVSWITTPIATWTTLILLLSIHLETNRRAVRAVRMRSLNRQRATIIYHHLRRGHVPTTEEVSDEEHIFKRSGILRTSTGRAVGHCTVGMSFSQLLAVIGSQNRTTKSSQIAVYLLPRLLNTYKDRPYLLWYTGGKNWLDVQVIIKRSASNTDIITAWWQALSLVNESLGSAASSKEKHERESDDNIDQKFELLERSKEAAVKLLSDFETELKKNGGWDLNVAALETTSSTRISLRS